MMEVREQDRSSHLFVVRIWLEEPAEGQANWRGRAQYLVTGEVTYFREWAALVTFLQQMLQENVDRKLMRSEGSI